MWFKRWCSENLSLRTVLAGFKRPVLLIFVGLGIPLFSAYAITRGWIPGFTRPDGLDWPEGSPDWRALAQPILLFVAAPAAFILWAFRDFNAQANLENQRKDINLKEFQEIQLRAAGAMDEKLPAKARETLQIAAIHQLRPFLRGEYGASFRRPAWELLRARLETSAQTSGLAAITEWAEQVEKFREMKTVTEDYGQAIKTELFLALKKVEPDPVTEAERIVIAEETDRIFRRDLPLVGSRFGQCHFSRRVFSGLALNGCSFVDANLNGAHFEESWLLRAHFAKADMSGAKLEKAFLYSASFMAANLASARLDGANLEKANFDGADLYFASLKVVLADDASFLGTELFGADLEGGSFNQAKFAGANLSSVNPNDPGSLVGATFDDSTAFRRGWSDLPEEEKAEFRKPWIDRGMIHVDDVESDDG